MPTMPDSVLRFTGATAAMGLCVALAGCVQAPRTTPPQPSVAASDATGEEPLPRSLSHLAAKATSEAAKQRNQAPVDPLPPGISAALAARLQPGADADPIRVRMGRDEAIAELAASLPRQSPRASELSPSDAQTAITLYIAGREKLLNGNAAGAVTDLRRATELDPSAGEPWRELGEAQLAAGSRIDTMSSFERSLACGLEDPRVLEQLGRSALDRSEPQRAAPLLSRALLASPERSDPLLPTVIDLSLSKAMVQSGYTTAGRDLLLLVLTRSPQLSASTRYGEEFSALQRRQGDLWREVGDLCCRLGQYDRAVDAYARAQSLPSMDDDAIGPRLVYASLRSGRPHTAALAVVRRIAAEQGRVTAGDAALLRYLGRYTATGPEIAAALKSLPTELPSPLKPTIERDMTTARAAIAGGAEGAAILREYASSHAVDPSLARAIVAAAPDAAGAVHESLSVVSSQPRSAVRFAEALLESDYEIAALDSAFASEGKREEVGLLRGYFLLQRGLAVQAADQARELTDGGRLAGAAAMARVELGVAAGALDTADRGLAALRTQAAPARSFYLARSLAWFQFNKAALAELEPMVTSASTDMDHLLLAAELAVSLDRGDDAERWLLRARELDPFDDRPYSRMLVIYGVGGVKAESAKLNQTVRELREFVPDSRTLRAARTKELARRSLLSQAEGEANSLAEEDLGDVAAIDLLVSIWRARAEQEGPGKLNQGKLWLESKLARRPGSPALMAGLTTILVAQGDAAGAAERLQEAIQAGGPPDLSRMREKLLRDNLSRPDEANALALARLQGRDRTIGESIELAEVLALTGDDVRAAQTVLSAATSEVALAHDQETRILVLTGQMSQRAVEKPDEARRGAVVQLFDLLVARNVKFSPDMHQRRLVVMALWPEVDADRLLAAAAFTTREYPNLGSAPFYRTSQALTAANRGVVAQVFIAKAAERATDPSLDLFTEWFRVTAMVGTPAHARALIAKAQSAGKLRELVSRVSGQTEAELSGRDPRAQAAYVLGNYYASDNRTEQAEAAYELALEYEPSHPWACNNLGYSLLERGTDLERAGVLLERAHAALPEEAAITDSLGWLRYKQGILYDERGPDGAVSRRGAVNLLQAAAKTDRGQRDPTILNHYGDALWLAGRAEDARRYWELTQRVASRLLTPSQNPAGRDGDPQKEAPSPAPAALEELKTLRESAAAKFEAAQKGGAVRVAPQFGNADPKPAPNAPGESQPSLIPDDRGEPAKDGASEVPVSKRID